MITNINKKEVAFKNNHFKEPDSLILSVTDDNYLGYWVQFDFEYGNLISEIQKGIDKYFNRVNPLSPILLSKTYYGDDVFKNYLMNIINISTIYPVFQQEWLNKNTYIIQVHVVKGVHLYE